MKEHFCNYPTMQEAVERADSMNQLAKAELARVAKLPAFERLNHGLGFMNLCRYTYSAGPAVFSADVDQSKLQGWGGLYRQEGREP